MIPFTDLKAHHLAIQAQIQDAITRVLASGRFVLGSEVAAFEEEFSGFCKARHGIGVNSGTSALHLALLAAGVGPGDEVITVPFTFVATVAAIRYTGAKPVLVDIDPRSLTMDVTRLQSAITKRTKAIIPVHLYGHPADMDPILDLARSHSLVVIEDAAQAHGARYKGRRVGSIGDMGCFSFYPGKNLGACGEGGMVVTNDPAYARMLCMLRDWGAERKYHHELLGYNYRMEAIQATILRVKLRRLEIWTEARQKLAARYDELLADSPVAIPPKLPWADHVYHLYPVRLPERDRLQQALHDQGIQTGIHYPVPIHLQPWAKELGYRRGDFPCSEEAASTVLSLPLYPELSEGHVQEVAKAVALAAQPRKPTMVALHAQCR